MVDTPETKVKKKVKKWLENHAAWWSGISDRYHIGLPDYLCILKEDIHKGTLTAIEVKSDVGRLTLRQLEEARRIQAAGGCYCVARPSNLSIDGFVLNEVNHSLRGVKL